MKAQMFTPGLVLPYYTATAATGGTVVKVAGMAGVLSSDIAALGTGSAQISGIIKIEHIATVGNAGDNVWYDANGSPYGGTASSGGATTVQTAAAAAADMWLGTLSEATTATSTHCYVRLNEANPALPVWQDRTHLLTAADLTMVAATHSGGVIHVTKDAGTDTTILFPAGVVGMEYIIINDEADAGNGCLIDFNGNEIVEGMNLTIAATKMVQNTKATSIRSDWIHLICQVAATSWRCVGKRGTWATTA